MGTKPSIILVEYGNFPVEAVGDRDEGILPSWGRCGHLIPPWKGFGLYSLLDLAGSGQ